MTPEDIAARYNRQPGFRLISYERVALPFWIATFDALVIAEKNVPVIDEFLLRAIEQRVSSSADLAGFLGLSEKLIVRRLGGLLNDDYIVVKPAVDGLPSLIDLTRKGEEALRSVARTKPRRERIAIPYDAIARRPIVGKLERGSVLRPQEIKKFGLFEIPALPTPRTPSDEELAAIDFSRAVPKELRRDLSIHQVLSATKTGSLDRRAREAVMLIYCGEKDEEQLLVRFFSLDARPLPDIDRGFLLNGGLQKLNLQIKLKEHRERLKQELMEDPEFALVVQFADAVIASGEKVAATLAKDAQIKADIQDKETSIRKEARSPDGDRLTIERLQKELHDLKAAKASLEHDLAETPARAVESHEHVTCFTRALSDAKHRLMIISPWIKDRLMQAHWFKVENLLKRKVKVFIGYGITKRRGDEEADARDNGERTIEFFTRMAQTYPDFMYFVKLGDTHAKVLLKDNDTLIAGSFNWMSFGGMDKAANGANVVRDEVSILVSEPREVEKMFKRYVARFAKFDRRLEAYLGGKPT